MKLVHLIQSADKKFVNELLAKMNEWRHFEN